MERFCQRPNGAVAAASSVFLLVVIFASTANAGPVEFIGTSGELSASAKFKADGGDLVITLTNISTNDVLVPADVLTGVFFDLSPNVALTRVSAILASGSVVVFGPAPAGGVVGGEFAYVEGLSGAPGGASRGISSTGLGLFGPGDLFPGPDLDPPTSPNGLNYGLTSAGDDLSTGNAKVTGSEALINNSVVFRLSGLPSGFDPMAAGAITNVQFQYGTDLSEPSFEATPTPEPASIFLLGIGCVGLVRFRSKKNSVI